MESEDNFSDNVFKPRSALTDMTNFPSKRPFSSISVEDGVEKFLKRKFPNNDNDKGKNLCFELPFSGNNNNSSQEPSLPSGGTDDSNDSFVEKDQGRSSDEGFMDRAIEHDDDLGSPKCENLGAIVPASKFLGLERCSSFKGQGGENFDAHVGVEFIKNCTCSFCSKAAYIWSDLHYQDAKGRLTALRKSQKEARLVVQKFSGINDTHTIIHEQQGGTDPSDLESTLLHQWKSLFVQMENFLGHESRQLESRFESLKDLRENCKNDLESINTNNSGNH